MRVKQATNMPEFKWLPLIYPAVTSSNDSMPRIDAAATVGLHRSGSGVATQVSESLEVWDWGLWGWGQAIHGGQFTPNGDRQLQEADPRTANWGEHEEADRASAWDTDREWGQAMSSGPYMNHA